jgi:carboxyl-terminal processing protease
MEDCRLMAPKRRSFFIVSVVILSCSLAGGIYGQRVQAAASQKDDDVKAGLKTFTKAYGLVEENFADPVAPDKAIYDGAIPGMLRTLDPHSSFQDPKAFARMREEQRGNYYGVGMRVVMRGTAGSIVFEPFKGSPAWKAGLRPGDLIISVNGANSRGMNTEQVAGLLKGPRGTKAKIEVEREGSAKPISFEVVRDAINVTSVPDPVSLNGGIYYIRVEQFMETTSRDLQAGLSKVGEENIKGLILDLRGNPGGLVNEGVAVADKFLNKGDVIVSHHGRAAEAGKETVYRASTGNHGNKYPIVVLVNRSSASAAEIVTGALQDHDRAWVFGDNTFGKGLVQSVYPLIENSGLLLVTAKYYTPSGRLIQRDYSHESFYDYYFKQNTEARNLQDVKMTDSGRTVYGGGGISPDEKYVSPKYDKFELELARNNVYFDFTTRYLGTKDVKVTADWRPDTAVLNDFHGFLLEKKVPFTEADFTQDNDWVKRQLTMAVLWSGLSDDDSHAYEEMTDPEVLKAVDSLPKAQALLNSVTKLIVQRRVR